MNPVPRLCLRHGWRFLLDDPASASAHAYWERRVDDSGWREISIPHDWSVEGAFSSDLSSGTGYLPGGVGWYRLRFDLPEEWKDRRLWIEFDGIYKNSRVWLNGSHLGGRPSGYASFRLAADGRARFGSDNLLVVLVRHPDVADSRWFTGSGIYRDVSLLALPSLHIEPESLFFRTPRVTAAAADLELELTVSNTGDTSDTATITSDLLDAEKCRKASFTQIVQLAAGESHTVRMTAPFPEPRLWSDDAPHLYSLETRVAVRGAETTQDCRRVGIRSVRFDPDSGFLINGRNKKLRGVCLHHDAGCLGAAVPENVWRRRLLKLKAVGCNAIRGSHNQHAATLTRLCDELGFYFIPEAFDEWENPKNKWWQGHNVYPPRLTGAAWDFPTWHEADLRALILRDRNAPSVIAWSIGNEIDYPNDPYCHPLFKEMTGNNDSGKPAAERIYDPDKPDASRLPVLAGHLAAIVRAADPTRAVTAGVAFPELSSRLGFLDPLDLVGYNYKEPLYFADHKRFPDKPFLGSENKHSHEAFRAAEDLPYIAGQFLWTGIDYLGESRGPWPVHGTPSGLLDLAGFEKPLYWFRKALWTEAPFVKILAAPAGSEDFRPLWKFMPGGTICVRAFTNQPGVSLFLNGEPVGAAPVCAGIAEWNLPFQAGRLDAKAGTASDALETHGSPARIRLTLCDPPTPGEDISQIEIHITDEQGRLCADFDGPLALTLHGSARLAGIENGDLADPVPYTEPVRKTLAGRAIVYVRHLAGQRNASLRARIAEAGTAFECVCS